MDDLQRRLVNKRLANKAQDAIETGETYASKIAGIASEADGLLSELSDTTQMSLPERMLRAMTVRHKLAMILAYANHIAGAMGSVFDARRQTKNGNGSSVSEHDE